MGIIYKAENLVTGEVYIGQSKKPLCEKKRDHVYEAFKRFAPNKFHKALREFGLKNFLWSVVDECSDYTRLSKMEKKYIKKYDSINNGYNTQIRYDANAINRINEKNYRNNFKKGVNDENF